MTVSVVIPTKNRPSYLDAALASLRGQAGATAVELLVVDDHSSGAHARENERTVRLHAGSYYGLGERTGLNAARNAGIERSAGELIVFLDDDVELWPGWLQALQQAAANSPAVAVFTGPIRPVMRGRGLHTCARNEPEITALDFGPDDCDVEYAWGANLAIRRSAFERLGQFDEALSGCGDEEEWLDRYRVSGGVIRYVAAAGVDHVRSGADAHLRRLMRAHYARGRTARRYNAYLGTAPSFAQELRVLFGCLWHSVRAHCEGGLLQTAHAAGRLFELIRVAGGSCRRFGGHPRQARNPLSPAPPARTAGVTQPSAQRTHSAGGRELDFLSGHSGNVEGARATLTALASDLVEDVGRWVRLEPWRLDRAARGLPVKRVLVLCVDGGSRPEVLERARQELERSHHTVTFASRRAQGRGKFENLNLLLADQTLGQYDWLLVVDDDVTLPRNFLDRFLFLATHFDIRLAQPAHRAYSHAAWQLTRRQRGSVLRETAFVEIGPVTALHSDTLTELLPFPDLRMGWGLDAHWAAVAHGRGWKAGIVDATAVGHRHTPIASGYSRDDAVAEAENFLAERSYLDREKIEQTLAVHRSWQ